MQEAIELNCRLIEEHEQNFARALAAQVIPLPRWRGWRVLIPLISIYQRGRYRLGNRRFIRYYLRNRKRALEEACKSELADRDPDLARLTESSCLPEEAQTAYRNFIHVLLHHYQMLLEAEGGTFAELVRAAYGNKSNYLLFCSELRQAEMDLNSALEPHMAAKTEGYREAAEELEQASEERRRKEAEGIFA